MDDPLKCMNCGREMRYNVPRLGPDGGFVHADTGSFLCDDPITQSAATVYSLVAPAIEDDNFTR